MKYAIYSRKSKFTGRGESVENQVQLCREYIGRCFPDDSKKVIEVFEDEGFSGKNTARPELRRMLAAARREKFDYIVCYRLDRISRDVGDFSALIEDLQRNKISFVCIREQFDTSTPMGRAMMYIASVFAQLERETIAERIRDNMLMLARTGRWLGGTTPLGFACEQTKETEGGKVKTVSRLTPVEEEQDVVRLIFGKYLELRSMAKVEEYLARQDIRTRKVKCFSAAALREILSNPVYCAADQTAYDYFYERDSDICREKGEFDGAHGILAYRRTAAENNRQRKKSTPEWIIAIGKHRGIVDGESWVKAQSVLELNRPKSNHKRVQNPAALLSGLLFCQSCGSLMRPRVNSNKRRDDHGNQTFAYLCELKKRSKGEKCDCPNISGNSLDEAVCGEILKRYRLSPAIAERLSVLKKRSANGSPATRRTAGSVKAKIGEKKAGIKRLVAAIGRSGEDSALYEYASREIESLNRQIKALETELCLLQEEAPVTGANAANGVSVQTAVIEDGLKSLADAFSTSAAHDKRTFLRAVIDKIEWDGGQVHIFLYGGP